MGPASLAKVMTLKVAFEMIENGSLSASDSVTVSEKAWQTVGSRMWLKPGTEVELSEIFKGIAVSSGNDACVALAEHASGTEESFVAVMNRRAQSLGLEDTSFENSHGLPSEKQKTTALDMALLTRSTIALHPQIMELMATKEYSYRHAPPAARPMRNRNGLLWRDERVNGFKTGHTGEDGYHLIATALDQDEEMFLAAVVMGVQGVEKEEGFQIRESEAYALLRHGFNNYHTVDLGQKPWRWQERVEPRLRVWKGEEDWVALEPKFEPLVTVSRGRQPKDLTFEPHFKSEVVAPVAAGADLGHVTVKGTEFSFRLPLQAAEAVPRGGFWQTLWDSILLFFRRLAENR